MKLLCLDIGNSRVKGGVFEQLELKQLFSFRTTELPEKLLSLDELANDAEATAICSVVPEASDVLSKALKRAHFLKAENSELRVEYDASTLGGDRLALAHYVREFVRRDCVALDAGSAITVDAVAADGSFLGGAIMPGPQMVLTAMSRGAAALPNVELAQKEIRPAGRSTEECMLSGALFSVMGGAESLVGAVGLSAGLKEPGLLLTGGGSPALYSLWPDALKELHASLMGLAAWRVTPPPAPASD